MLNIEKEIFLRTRLNINKLLFYGFVKEQNHYKCSKLFLNNFRADIEIDETGNVTGKIFDLSIEEEYINFRVENQTGEFVNSVREEYINILKDIKENCFEKLYFITDQANRITRKIIEIYHNVPEFLWEKFPEYGIFRNPTNEKWYALIMNIDTSKIDKHKTGKVEIINLKLDTKRISTLLKKKGFYPSYHMNKKNWITITLDDTIKDAEILKYVSDSHKYTETTDEWIVPANPKYYDIINCFSQKNTIEWKQSSTIKVGDIVYLYVSAPYSAILYKCEAVEVNIPYEYKDKNINMNYVMKIKLQEKYNQSKYPFSKLNEYGIKAIRGPRRITEELSKELNKNSC